jgi:hypothetical protein
MLVGTSPTKDRSGFFVGGTFCAVALCAFDDTAKMTIKDPSSTIVLITHSPTCVRPKLDWVEIKTSTIANAGEAAGFFQLLWV